MTKYQTKNRECEKMNDQADNIIKTLRDSGYESYLVGGAVRDLFSGKIPSDKDIVTNASPEEIEKLFPFSKINITGKQFLVTIVDQIEVATYRSDQNCNIIGKDVTQTTKCETIQEDLSRRDFTINAMAFCPFSETLIDPFNGKDDLKKGIIKFVGDPKKRIFEDPCRILRACRMASVISGHIESDSLSAMIKYKDLVKEYVKPERIRLEILKAMKTDYPGTFFYYLRKIDLLEFIFPSLHSTINCDGGQYHGETVYAHSIVVGNSIRPSRKTANKMSLIRLAGFLHDIGKPEALKENNGESFIGHDKIGSEILKEELKNLKFSNSEIDYISGLVELHMRLFSDVISKKTIRKFIMKLNDQKISYMDWLRIRIADKKGNLKNKSFSLQEIKDKINAIEDVLTEEKFVSKLSLLKLNGKDVMKITGLKPCKKIGIILNRLLEIVIADPTQNTKKLLTFHLTNR